MSINNECEHEPLLGTEQRERKFIATCELPVLAVSFGASLSATVVNNLLLYRTCVIDLKHNVTTCELLQQGIQTEEAQELEKEVQMHTTFLLLTLSVASGVAPAVLSFFTGAWSDKHGRKPLVLLPLFGITLCSALILTFSMMPNLSSWWYLVCVLPYTLFGGDGTLALGTNLLVTDVTDDDNRSFRLALLQGCMFTGLMLGSVASSYVFAAVGYNYLFAITALVSLFSFIYTLFFVEESLTSATRGTLRGLFKFQLVSDMFSTCFKRRNGHVGITIILLILAYSITIFTISGYMNIDYLFTRLKFQWLLKEYSIYSAVYTIILVFGMVVGIAILQNVCRMSDGVLAILAYISLISDTLMRCFAKKSWHMYLAASMSMLGGLSPPVIRSMVTKSVAPDEVGRFFALISCVDSVLPIFSPILFNMVYAKTLRFFPGAIYGLSASFFVVCLFLIISAQCLEIRHKTVNTKKKYSLLPQKELDPLA